MTRGGQRWACDTSVALAALDPQHEAHGPCRRVLVEWRPALAGHAVFETYSVLTRLPPPLRLTPKQAGQVLGAAFPQVCWLEAEHGAQLRADLGGLGVVGGAVYDALVGKAALAHDRVLLTRDRRAERTYRAIGVEYEVVD